MSAQLAYDPGAWTRVPAAWHPAPVREARLRFDSVEDVYGAFPTAACDVGAEPGARRSLAFLADCMEEERWSVGLSFAAYLLPRREAVWWGSRSLRRTMREVAGVEALEAAEAWVRQPEEPQRREALRVGSEGDGRLASTWIALAAGWSGGSIAPPECGSVPARPSQTPKSVRAALLIVLSRMPAELQPRLLRPCLEHAVSLARGLPDET